jgi:alcohol dehydrogenase, propanol-preferring
MEFFMRAMILEKIQDLKKNSEPLKPVEIPKPEISGNEVLIKVSACGICHTELDEIEGRTPPPVFPMVLGHQVIGKIEKTGNKNSIHKIGDRIGVAWINSSCGKCEFCLNGNENLCPEFKATGRDSFGGYAEYMSVDERFIYPIPKIFSDFEAAPLLCAGAIGYRSLNLSGISDDQNLGLSGFGASAHLVLKLVKYKYPSIRIFVFARNKKEQEFALELGADWAGDIENRAPEKLNAIIDTTPVWNTIVEGLANLKSGGRFIINAIRKEENDKNELLKIQYPEHLWMEKEIKSVANVCSSDVREFLNIASKIPIKPEYQVYELEQANIALLELKQKKIRGAKVLKICQ